MYYIIMITIISKY